MWDYWNETECFLEAPKDVLVFETFFIYSVIFSHNQLAECSNCTCCFFNGFVWFLSPIVPHREAGAQLQGSMMSASSSETNPSSVTNQADYNRSRSLPERQSEPLHMQGALQQRSRSANFVSTGGVAVAVSPPLPEGNFPVLQEGTSTSQSPRSSHQHSSESDITAFSSLPSSPRDESVSEVQQCLLNRKQVHVAR